MIEGRVHLLNDDFQITSIGNKIRIWSIRDDFSKTIIPEISSFSRNHLLSRLSREAIHFVFRVKDRLVVFVKGQIQLIDFNDGKVIKKIPIVGSRPLVPSNIKGIIYFGDYFSNKNRQSVNLYSFDASTGVLKIFYIFEGVRHIHGVFYDTYENDIYVTTGDYDEENGIWKYSPNDSKFIKILGGNQQTRAVSLLFSEEFIFYGTDTPLEQNFIYRVSKKDYSETEKIQKVSSSIFYSYQNEKLMAFTTAVEPSKVNKTKFVEVWVSLDKGATWEVVARHKKDFFPFQFQYGQAIFPLENNTDNLIYYLYGTQNSNNTIQINCAK